MTTFTAEGSDGTLVVCAATGAILERRGDGEQTCYPDIARFDVDEWRAFYPGEQLEGQSVDVLDLAAHLTCGLYEPAEPEWREALAQERKEAPRT